MTIQTPDVLQSKNATETVWGTLRLIADKVEAQAKAHAYGGMMPASTVYFPLKTVHIEIHDAMYTIIEVDLE